MMSCDVTMARVTSAGTSVTHSTSRPQQPSFAYASDGAGPVHKDHITGECNLGQRALVTLWVHKG